MPQYQMQMEEQQQKRKRKKGGKLEFDPAKVFGPEEAKKGDFDIDLKRDKDSARYKAQHGEGGDRVKATGDKAKIYGRDDLVTKKLPDGTEFYGLRDKRKH